MSPNLIILVIYKYNNIKYMILFILFVFLYLYVYKDLKLSGWSQCSGSSQDNIILKQVLKKHNIKRSYDSNWILYLPCKQNYYKQIHPTNHKQKVSIISNNYIIASKKSLWLILEKKYGRFISSKIMPETYIFPKHKSLFLNKYSKHKYYLLKKDIQRQKGIKISNNLDDILNYKKNKYVCVQELLKDPFCVNGYKLNIRIYILIICNKGQIKCYRYPDGIISYSGKKYKDNNDFNTNISSFYSSKKLYDIGYPILISELGLNFNKIDNILRMVMTAAYDKICNSNSSLTFQLFGVDFLLDKHKNPKILEINIGPGMSKYCSRDYKMRFRLQEDILSCIGLINQKHDFKLIWTH